MGYNVGVSMNFSLLFLQMTLNIFEIEFRRMIRKHVLSANTQFTCAQFFPSGVQVLTTGTDRKISYWEVFDGSLVRYVEGSSKRCINWLSINSSGEMFVSAGVDQIVKVCSSLK